MGTKKSEETIVPPQGLMQPKLYSNLQSLIFTTQISNSQSQKIYEKYAINDNLIIPSGNVKRFTSDPYYDKQLLPSFIKLNAFNLTGVQEWTLKYGLLYNEKIDSDTHDLRFNYPEYLALTSFQREHQLITELHQLIKFLSTDDSRNEDSLKKSVRVIKIADYIHEIPRFKEGENQSKHTANAYFVTPEDMSIEVYDNKDKEFFPNVSAYSEKYIATFYGKPVFFLFDNKVSIIEATLLGLGKVLWHKIFPGLRHGWYVEVTNDNDYFPYRLGASLQCADLRTMLYFQLAWLISPNNKLKKCAKCGSPFVPDGERPGKAIYCHSCGQYAAQNKLKSDKREANKLFMSGVSPNEIAQQLNRSIGQITKWLSEKEGEHYAQQNP